MRAHRLLREKMANVLELEEYYTNLEEQRFKLPVRKFEQYAKELETRIKKAEEELTLRSNQIQVKRNGLDGRACQKKATKKNKQFDQRGTSEAQNHWMIQRQEIFITDEVMETGGWGDVKVAEFRGIKVCAKYPHHAVWSEHHFQLFMHEMSLASRVHHPNIVLFIGACVVKEFIVLTEIMPTSLRKQLEWKGNHLSSDQSITISLDVARALNYLHLLQPDPIIHRDISSANVMLEPLPSKGWRAKLAGHCSINFKQKYRVTSSDVLVTPEAGSSRSLSPKMDIFSFGILIIEMCTAKIPEASSYERLITSIQDQNWVKLILDCISKDRDSRPSAAEIITALSHRHTLIRKVM